MTAPLVSPNCPLRGVLWTYCLSLPSASTALILPFLLFPSPTQGFGLGLDWGGCRQQCHQHDELLGSPETMWEMGEYWGALRPWGMNEGSLTTQGEKGCNEEP